MNLQFLVDAQLPIALARWIAAKGYPAIHVHDLGMEGSADSAIWAEALRRNATIITKDEDFVAVVRKGAAPQVVWVRIGNVSRRDLLLRLERVFAELIEALQAGESVVEIR